MQSLHCGKARLATCQSHSLLSRITITSYEQKAQWINLTFQSYVGTEAAHLVAKIGQVKSIMMWSVPDASGKKSLKGSTKMSIRTFIRRGDLRKRLMGAHYFAECPTCHGGTKPRYTLTPCPSCWGSQKIPKVSSTLLRAMVRLYQRSRRARL